MERGGCGSHKGSAWGEIKAQCEMSMRFPRTFLGHCRTQTVRTRRLYCIFLLLNDDHIPCHSFALLLCLQLPIFEMLFSLEENPKKASVPVFIVNETPPVIPDTGWPGHLFDEEDRWPVT